jgi:hypothetical protein
MSENNPIYDINDPRWDRAMSPLPNDIEKMSENDVMRELRSGITFQELPLNQLSRFESYVKKPLGFDVPRGIDKNALMRAKRMIKTYRARNQRSKEHAYDQMIKRLNDEAQMEADKRRAMENEQYDLKRKLARAAAITRAEAGPRVPITQRMINAARSGLNKLRNSRVWGHTLSSDYPTRAFEHDVAQDEFGRLVKAYNKQERETPGAQYLKPLPYPSNDPADNQAFPFANPKLKPKGGKSKRVKSKRVKSKRRTQRRNTRK